MHSLADYSGSREQPEESHVVGAQTLMGGRGGSSQASDPRAGPSPSCAAGVSLVSNTEQKEGPRDQWGQGSARQQLT